MRPFPVLLAACFVASFSLSCATTQSMEPANLPSEIQAAKQGLMTAHAKGQNEKEAAYLLLLQAYTTLNGELSSAIQYGQELLKVLNLIREFPFAEEMEARSLNLLASDYLLIGNTANSISLAERARVLSLRIRDTDNEEMALGTLALASEQRMEFAAAVRWWKEALRLALRTKNQQAEAEILGKLGDAYIGQHDYVSAIRFCSQSLNANEAARSSALVCLGESYDALQEPETAWKYLEEALHRAEREKSSASMSIVARSIVMHYLVLGKLAEAAKWMRQSADLLVAATSKRNSADKTSTLESQALSSFQPNSEMFRGVAEIIERRAHQAVPHLERAFDLWSANKKAPAEMRFLFQSKTLALLGYSYIIAGEPEKGLPYMQRQWELTKNHPLPLVRAYGSHCLGLALWSTGRLQQAEETLRGTISEWDATRTEPNAVDSPEKGTFLDTQTETYDLLIQVLIDEGRQEEALEIAERERARSLVTTLARQLNSRLARPGFPEPPKIETLRELARQRNLTLVEYSILYDPLGPLLPSRIGGKQPELEQDLLVWLIKPSGEIIFQKTDLKLLREQTGNSLAETTRRLRTSVGGRGRGVEPLADRDLDEPLHSLYDLLIAPIAEHLPTDPEARIVFVPQGPLFLVPFAALRAPSGRYLIEDHTILSAPSIDALASIQRHTFRADWKPDEVLVVGNPTIAAELELTPYNLPSLPESSKEAAAIASIFGAQPLTGDRAGKTAILQILPQRRLLHLATHGLLEGFGDPLIPGALVLAPGKDDDGLLTAKEILTMNLHADLAVLSACDTGGGRITSDGVIGLSRAFLLAGVPSVVVSLWSVPDAPTSELMQRFYRELKKDPDPGRALRQAMLATMRMKESSSPRSWAGFTLIGGF